jgi:uncharacterized ferritin-like protein (DUF455 family)
MHRQAPTHQTSLSRAVTRVLLTADPEAKVMATRQIARAWRLGVLDHSFDTPMPDTPVRRATPILLPPNRMPRRGGSGSKQVALIHALAHIEFVAIDLALDMIGRFGNGLPRSFVDDWMKVAADEAMHFALLFRRLKTLGSHYGALPAHDGLWEAATETSHDLLARLAIVPLVLEARGLDVSPSTISRFEGAGDRTSARILTRIYADEINHVGTGFRWFSVVCANQHLEPEATWQMLVRSHFRGGLKPPFNDSARESAGLTRNFYSDLATSPASLT